MIQTYDFISYMMQHKKNIFFSWKILIILKISNDLQKRICFTTFLQNYLKYFTLNKTILFQTTYWLRYWDFFSNWNMTSTEIREIGLNHHFIDFFNTKPTNQIDRFQTFIYLNILKVIISLLNFITFLKICVQYISYYLFLVFLFFLRNICTLPTAIGQFDRSIKYFI